MFKQDETSLLAMEAFYLVAMAAHALTNRIYKEKDKILLFRLIELQAWAIQATYEHANIQRGKQIISEIRALIIN